MLRILCCQFRRTSRGEIDRITDTLETCLGTELGVAEFEKFLERNRFEEQRRTLQFFLKCKRTLMEIDGLSPGTRARELPRGIQTAITDLVLMSEHINFTAVQRNALEVLRLNDTDEKVRVIKDAQNWALDLLQDVYVVFRREALKKV